MKKWLIDMGYRWLIQAAKNSKGDLYRTYPNVKIMIEDEYLRNRSWSVYSFKQAF